MSRFVAVAILALLTACSSSTLEQQQAAELQVRAQIEAECRAVHGSESAEYSSCLRDRKGDFSRGVATAAMAGAGVAIMAGSLVIMSDVNAKRDIVKVAALGNGLSLYRFRYRWSDRQYVGVLAQEVERVRPDAVVRLGDGYLRVDYGKLGLRPMTWQQWSREQWSREHRQAEHPGWPSSGLGHPL